MFPDYTSWSSAGPKNLLLNGATAGTSAAGVIAFPVATAPTTSPTDVLQMWAGYDVGSNLVPNMTSATTPSGVCSFDAGAQSYNWSSFATTQTYGAASNIPTNCWFQYQFTSAQTIVYYSITPWSFDSFPARSPTSWTLAGSNDGTNWTTLDTRTVSSGSWVQNVPASFTVATPGSYAYYRLAVTANGGDATYTGIKRLQLMAQAMALKVRDSTGAVKTVTLT